MHVIIRIPRNIVVNNELDVGDIETTRSNVCSDEDAGGAGAETGEVCGALSLWEEGVEGGGAVIEGVQETGEEGGGGSAVGEDDGGFFKVQGGKEEGVEVGLACLDGDLEVGLMEGRGNRQRGAAGGGVDFANIQGGFGGATGEVFECEDFGC